MKKPVKVEKVRLERFKFEPVREFKATLREKPELRDSLKKDFQSTLISQGLTLDDEFKNKIRTEWRSTIKSDVKRVADEAPDRENWYLKQVLEGNPIKLKVKIDKKTGKNEKSLRRSQ